MHPRRACVFEWGEAVAILEIAEARFLELCEADHVLSIEDGDLAAFLTLLRDVGAAEESVELDLPEEAIFRDDGSFVVSVLFESGVAFIEVTGKFGRSDDGWFVDFLRGC